MEQSYNEIEVFLYGEKVGTLYDDHSRIIFRYSIPFKNKNLEISPIMLNTKTTPIQYINEDFPEIYKMLPGVFKDSLPDSNGEIIMNKYFKAKGIEAHQVTILHRLAFIGNRGMGALEYSPSEHSNTILNDVISVEELYAKNKELHTKNEENIHIDEVMAYLIDSISPVGGAKEKALICFNPSNEKIRFCQSGGFSKDGYVPYLIKFDKDGDAFEETKKEYIYTCLARLCGIDVKDHYLIDDGNKKHFLIKRFDRENDEKIHMSTVSALLHKPHYKDAVSYEELVRLTYELTNDISQVKAIIQRMIFNIMFLVTDDHSKNFSFTMSKNGVWKLSPAYDLIYGLGVGALSHRTPLNGKNKDFTLEDIMSITKGFKIEDEEIIDMIVTIHKVYNENFTSLCERVKLQDATRNGMKDNIQKSMNMIFGEY